MRRILGELKRVYGLNDVIPKEENELFSALREWAIKCSDADHRVVITPLQRMRAFTLLANWRLAANRLVAARKSAKELELVARKANDFRVIVEALEMQATILRKATSHADVRGFRGLTDDADIL